MATAEMESKKQQFSEAANYEEELQQLIATLPQNSEGMFPLYKYNCFWFLERYLLGIKLMEINNIFSPRPTDVFIASQPKSGTTWLRALTFATLHRKEYSPLTSIPNPLLNLHPHECVPFLENALSNGLSQRIESLPSPRILCFHTPFSMLPLSITDDSSSCRILYVCREPKDTFTSLWYFQNSILMSNGEKPIPLEKEFDLFCNGINVFGPLWDHILEYWTESQRRPEKILFLRYEEILADTAKILRRMAEFMGCGFTEEEDRMGLVEHIVDICRFDSLSSIQETKNGHFTFTNTNMIVKKSCFFRKGGVGDWLNSLTPEMAERLDKIIRDKFKGSGLNF